MISTTKGMRSHSLTVSRVIPFPLRWLYLPQGVGLAIAAAVIYAFTTVVTKKGLTYLPPVTLLTVQTLGSAVFFWSIVLWQKRSIPCGFDTFKVASAGLLEPGLSYLFGTLGLSLTSASNASFVSTMEPVITIGLAWLILKEYVSKSMLGLGCLACVGVGLVAVPPAQGVALASLGGNVLVLLSVFFASLYGIVSANAVRTMSPVVIAALQQSVGLLFALVMTAIVWALGWESLTWNAATCLGLLTALVSGAFGYGIAFLLYLMALRYLSASRIAVYLTLIPVFGIFAAYWLLGEGLVFLQGIGGLLILFAVIKISQIPQPAN
jgi:drug/metabolite transporter (DMT)-like permease